MHLSWSGKNDLLGTCCEMRLHLRWRKAKRYISISNGERDREVRGKLGSGKQSLSLQPRTLL